MVWQEFVQLDEYTLKECTIDKLIEFIEDKFTKDNRYKCRVWIQIKGHERIWPYKISFYKDYYRGQIVSITPTGAQRGECSVNDDHYREFIEEMIRRGENANIKSL